MHNIQTENMNASIASVAPPPDWIYDKRLLKLAPSVVDGIDQETELRYRKEGIVFIGNVYNALYLSSTLPEVLEVLSTASVYFHRFFMVHSFKDHSRYVAALACLLLAGKVSDKPKQTKNLLVEAEKQLTAHQFGAFGQDAKDSLINAERILIQTLRFDLQISNPFEFACECVKTWKNDRKQKVQNNAGKFIHHALQSTLYLQYESEVVAIGALELAVRMTLKKTETVDWQGRAGVRGERWWDLFVEGLGKEEVENIGHQILDLFPKPAAQPNKKPGETSTTPKPRVPPPSSAASHPVHVPPPRLNYQQMVLNPPPVAYQKR